MLGILDSEGFIDGWEVGHVLTEGFLDGFLLGRILIEGLLEGTKDGQEDGEYVFVFVGISV